MVLIIVTLSHYKINPDNFATAVAASVGDIVTSFVLGITSQYIFTSVTNYHTGYICDSSSVPIENSPLVPLIIIAISLLLFPITVYITCLDKSTKSVLFGAGAWTPILLSMFISFFSGAGLRFSAVIYRFMTLYQPLINGYAFYSVLS